jgi:hypothetical protein
MGMAGQVKPLGGSTYKNPFGNITQAMKPQQRPANAPVTFQSFSHFQPTISGPIRTDSRFAEMARNNAMARAAFAGDARAYRDGDGRGIRAGSAMQNYRAGMQGDSEAIRNIAEGQQEMAEQAMSDSQADLLYQERLAGEQAWIRDLLLDRDDIQNRDRMATYKRRADVLLGDYKRKIDDAIAARKREAMLLSSLL